MIQEDDEDRALRSYLFRHSFDILTPEERRIVQDAMNGRYILMYREQGNPSAARMLGRRLHDPEFVGLDEQALDAREMALTRTVLTRIGDEAVQRCGRCGRILRTPRARQCFHCGHDGHGAEDGPTTSSG